MKINIKRIEYYLPPKTENGQDLVRENPDWRINDIERKTGIETRHLADGQSTVEMAEIAVGQLLESGTPREDIDFLIFVTQSPLYALPTSACVLHGRLELKKSCMSFDVNLGCSGYIYALALGGSLIESGLAKQGLIVCSEIYSKYIAADDRTCRPLFSDGAAATMLGQSTSGEIGPFEMGTDGSGFESLIVREDKDSDVLPQGRLSMDGSRVFMFTMDMVPTCMKALMEKTEISLTDVDLFIFHQASKLVLDNVMRHMEIPSEKVFTNYRQIGNTVSASIPIALKQAEAEGRLKHGDTVMLVGFGVGYSWGGCLVKWSNE